MKTATCPYGRDVAIHGYPLKMTEIAATLEGTAYNVTRQARTYGSCHPQSKKGYPQGIRKLNEWQRIQFGGNCIDL